MVVRVPRGPPIVTWAPRPPIDTDVDRLPRFRRRPGRIWIERRKRKKPTAEVSGRRPAVVHDQAERRPRRAKLAQLRDDLFQPEIALLRASENGKSAGPTGWELYKFTQHRQLVLGVHIILQHERTKHVHRCPKGHVAVMI